MRSRILTSLAKYKVYDSWSGYRICHKEIIQSTIPVELLRVRMLVIGAKIPDKVKHQIKLTQYYNDEEWETHHHASLDSVGNVYSVLTPRVPRHNVNSDGEEICTAFMWYYNCQEPNWNAGWNKSFEFITVASGNGCNECDSDILQNGKIVQRTINPCPPPPFP